MSLRLRLEYSRGRAVAFISHLDLVRTVERAARRAGLPLAMTQGYNPRPRMAFAAPLPVGVLAGAEVMEIWLTGESMEAGKRLDQELPEGLSITRSRPVEADRPSVMSRVDAGSYKVVFSEESGGDTAPADESALRLAVRDILSRSEISMIRRRHGKCSRQMNMRPLILAMEHLGGGDVRALVRVGSQGNLRPQELVEILRRSIPSLPENSALLCRESVGRWTGKNLVPAWDL